MKLTDKKYLYDFWKPTERCKRNWQASLQTAHRTEYCSTILFSLFLVIKILFLLSITTVPSLYIFKTSNQLLLAGNLALITEKAEVYFPWHSATMSKCICLPPYLLSQKHAYSFWRITLLCWIFCFLHLISSSFFFDPCCSFWERVHRR